MSKDMEKVIESQKELLKEYEKENAELKQKYEELNNFEKSQCAKLLKENAELKAQIEKMKCCNNCKLYQCDKWRNGEIDYHYDKCDKWE